MANTPCADCGSSDALQIYQETNTSYCFSCASFKHLSDSPSVPSIKVAHSATIPCHNYESLPARGISQETCKHMGYARGYKQQIAHYYDYDGKLIAQKVRGAHKKFNVRGQLDGTFWNQHKWKTGGRIVVITEGEIDALTMSQIQGNKYPAVSLASGAQSAEKAFKANLEWLETFEKVVVCFDEDDAGRAALESVKGILTPGKLHIMSLDEKDPNAMLLAGKTEALVRAFWAAKKYTPEGILSASDIWAQVSDTAVVESIPYPWTGLNNKTHGARKGELVLLTAGSGVGKSSMMREMAYEFSNIQKAKCGLIFLEENAKRTALGLMSIAANQPLHLLDTPVKELEGYFKATISDDKITIFNHFGSLDYEALLQRIRYMVVSEGCKVVFLDHISILISGLGNDNERQALDMIMTSLASLAQELQFSLMLVSHIKRIDDRRKGEIRLTDLRGSAALEQLSDIVIAMERDLQADTNGNISQIRILKNRHTGETGVVTWLEYNRETGRLLECEEPSADTEGFTTEDPDEIFA